MAKKKKRVVQQKVVRKPRPFYMTLLIWVAAPLLGLVYLETLILFAGGMIPTMVAYIVDASKKKHISKTVGYANAAGCFVVALDMWTHNPTIDQALHLLSDTINWLIMFGTASVGWMLYFTMRPLVRTYLSVTLEVRRKRLLEVTGRLIEEWGDAVKARAPQLPPNMLKEDEIAIKTDLEKRGTTVTAKKNDKADDPVAPAAPEEKAKS